MDPLACARGSDGFALRPVSRFASLIGNTPESWPFLLLVLSHVTPADNPLRSPVFALLLGSLHELRAHREIHGNVAAGRGTITLRVVTQRMAGPRKRPTQAETRVGPDLRSAAIRQLRRLPYSSTRFILSTTKPPPFDNRVIPVPRRVNTQTETGLDPLRIAIHRLIAHSPVH